MEAESYLSFKIGNELFATSVCKVHNILEMQAITEIPDVPSYFKGVINLRGLVLPVVDIHVKFGMPPIVVSKDTCIIVADIVIAENTVQVGILVDAVDEVRELTAEDILPPPSMHMRHKSHFLRGMVKTGEKFMLLLDIDCLFSISELSCIQQEETV